MRVMNFFKSNQTPLIEDYKLTSKETEVLSHLSNGLSYKMVAEKMGISYFTVNAHVKKIYEKLQVHSLGEAISLALRKNIVSR